MIEKKEINLFWERLFEDSYLIRKIDFEDDILKELSKNSRYYISTEGHLNFIYEVTDTIVYNQCIELIDNIEETKEKGLLCKEYSLKNSQYENGGESDNRYSHFLIKKEIESNIIDFIGIDMKRLKIPFCFTLCNDFHIDILEKIRDKQLTIDTELLSHDKVQGSIIRMGTSKCCTNNYKANKVNIDGNVLFSSNNKIIQAVVDMKKGQILLWNANGKKEVINNLERNSKLNMMLSIRTSYLKELNHSENLPKINLCKKEGYIYLKPIEIFLKSIQVIMIYTGNPTIQYYDVYRKSWQDIKIGKSINIEGSIRFRLKLESGNKILDIAIIKSKEDMHKDYHIIKEIDFNTDLEIQKSDRYFVNKDIGSLEGSLTKIEEIEYSNCTTVLGKMKIYDQGISLIPKVYKGINNSTKFSQLLVEKIFDKKESDTVFIEFEKSKYGGLNIMLCNKAFYNVARMIKSKKLPPDPQSYYASDSKVIQIKIDQSNGVSIYKTENGKTDIINFVKMQLKKAPKDLIINTKSKYIKIGSKKLKIPFYEYLNTEEIYINVLSYKNEPNNLINYDYIKTISYYKNGGYIYIKPIKNYGNRSKIIMFCKGNPECEYFLEEKGDWIKIEDKLDLDSNIILIRIKMSVEDKIYKLMLVTDK